jgi:uracil-DNA glycosylase
VAHCHEWFARTIDLLDARVYLALGQIAWRAVAGEARSRGWHQGPLPRFAHGASIELAGSRWLVGSYHPSQQNTFTGRLTEMMFDEVFALSKRLLDGP